MLPKSLHASPVQLLETAKDKWREGHAQSPPAPLASYRRKMCDVPKVQARMDHLLATAYDARSRARLLAAFAAESGAWLNARPVTSLGLYMDNDSIRVAIGLRLGANLCVLHRCEHCGNEVDQLATHGLSCKWSQGRHSRHSATNDILHSSLVSAKIPSCLEPSGLSRSDGRRPDRKET